MGKFLSWETNVLVNEKGFIPIRDLKLRDKIFILDEKSRYGWVNCWFQPEASLASGKIYRFFLRDVHEELLITRKYEASVVIGEDTICTVIFNGDIVKYRADALYRLICNCHNGQSHDIAMYSWGSNIRNRRKEDELVSVPIRYFGSKEINCDLMDLWYLDIPDDICILTKLDGNAIFV